MSKSAPDNVTRLFEAAQPSDFHRVPPMSVTADQALHKAGTRLRDYARWLDENHDLVIGALDVLVNNIIGTGIQVEPQAINRKGTAVPKFNKRVRELWNEWRKRPEITGELSFEELQRLACRSWLRDGEVFVEHVQGRVRANRRRTVPYCVRAMESDWLPFSKNDSKRGIVHGVEKDEDGATAAFHFYKALPDPVFQSYIQDDDTRSVPEERVEHLKFARRLNQTRGVTILHGVIRRLDDIKDAEESERIAMRVAAAFTAAIIRNPDMIDMPTSEHDAETGDVTGRDKHRYLEMGPGIVWDSLLPGEDIKGIGLDRPNTNLIEYLNDQHRRVASGVGASHSSISKRYDGTYSAQRQELVEAQPGYARLRDKFVTNLVRPIYERFVFWAIESGALMVPRDVRPETVARADFRAPGMPWIDPLKEIQADKLAVEAGFKSRHMVIRERGYDPELVDEQRAADPQPAAMAMPAADAPDNDEEDTDAQA